AGSQARLPIRREPGRVVRMNYVAPAPAFRLLPGVTRIVKPATAEEVAIAVGPGRPYRRRKRVDDGSEIAVAPPQDFPGPPAVIEIGIRFPPCQVFDRERQAPRSISGGLGK